MMWTDTPCRLTCWNWGYKTVEAMKDPKIECIIAQHPWLENDCLLADIILPSNTKLEEEDIATTAWAVPYDSVMLEGQCIPPVGESMSDYEIVGEIAKKLGMYEAYTEGKTVKEWIKYGYDGMNIQNLVSWEDLNKNGYYVFPTDPDWEKAPAGLARFCQNPEKNPLGTPSGKLEFYSARLAEHFPDDQERPPSPRWIEKGETHDERLSGERAKKYPLLIMSNHGRWRVHAQCDDITWTREIPTCKVKGHDGYLYEPLWINPIDAAKRDIKNGDIIQVYNERGIVLCGAIVWERMMPGVVYVDHGARVDSVVPEKVDRGGAINLISPYNITSKNAAGMATSGYLVEVAKINMKQIEEWKRQYPGAFSKEYDAGSGLCFSAWVE
jgi:anaerobic selenocysteine-containing dehydrogenase